MLKKAYIEIGNICNLSCAFCHGTARAQRFMTAEEFYSAALEISRHTEYVYLHVLGEPLLHPQFSEILEICERLDLKAVIVTNGTLIEQKKALLLGSGALYKICFSLHSFEANGNFSPAVYINNICAFAKEAKGQFIVSLRLWNGGGEDSLNAEIEALINAAFPGEHKKNRRGCTLAKNIFLEYGEKFDWPDLAAPEHPVSFCMALRDQVAVLCDGTVVPCCLDAEGTLALGNIFSQPLSDILNSKRAQDIYRGFSARRPCEELCRHCGKPEEF